MLRQLVESKRILVCAGPGGVGKTTTAAAAGVIAARAGRRTLVCTIDPAPRLADALGLPDLSAEPQPLGEAASRALGIPRPGLLLAARLDTAAAFNRLVEEQVADPEMRARIVANPIYRQITTTLTGSQEYAATLALEHLHRTGGHDLIVLDTPPTANALDFLEAPGRIAGAAASPAVHWFARPPAGVGRFSLERLRAGPAVLLRRLGKLVGSRFLDDLGAFLLDFRGVLDGFLARARAIEALLRRPEVGFLLVLAPEAPAVSEALFFASRLRASGMPLAGFVANRMLPRPGLADAARLQAELAAHPALAGVAAAEIARAADGLARAAGYLDRLSRAQEREIARLAHEAPGVDVARVPLLGDEISNLASLRAIGDHLGAGTPGPVAR